MVYPALLPLMLTPRLPVSECTDAPADLNGLVRFAEISFLRVCHHISNAFYHIHPVTPPSPPLDLASGTADVAYKYLFFDLRRFSEYAHAG